VAVARPARRGWRLSLLAAVLLASCSAGDDSLVGRVSGPEQGAASVALRVVPGAPSGSAVEEGFIDAHSYMDVSFARSGEIIEMAVQVGDTVRRGQLLGVLESESLGQRLAVARSQRTRARRSLPAARFTRGGRPPAYLEKSARARRAQITGLTSKQNADLRRLRRAVKEGGQEEATRVAISILEKRSRKPSTATAERLARDRHTQRLYDDLVDKVGNLQATIDASRLISPADGVVVQVNAFVGDNWNTRNRVSTFRLMDARRLVIWSLVPDKLARTLVPGMTVFAQLPNEDGTSLGPVVRAELDMVDVTQIESVRDDGELELLRQVRVALPARLPTAAEVGDDALVAFPR
jgi:multidrug efflux pump subunit AcrA (membrane-fusion protein)